MAKKDPAFLFYTSDFLTGTMFLTNEQIGIYVRLLCSQHQHGGLIDKISFNSLVGEHEIIRSKFIETESGYYNERLAREVELRANKSNNMSETAKKVWQQRKLFLEQELQKQYNCNTNVSENYTNVQKKGTKLIQSEDENEDELLNKKNIPTIEEFLNHALKKEPNVSKQAVKLKYDAWVEAGWKNGNGKKIIKWKANLNNTLPYLPKENKEAITNNRKQFT